jgi:4-methyl-5(b-hydroxyethyl)-thiazole monophosphate biosynthesis
MKKVCLLLANGFEAVEASVFTDVIGWNRLDGDQSTELVTVGTRPELRCTFDHFTVKPQLVIEELYVEEYDALAIPGGFSEAGFFDDAYQESFLEVIREFDARGKIIASICVGSLPIGRSGVLKNRRATAYNLDERIFQKELATFGAVVIPDEAIVIDNNIITSFNPATAFDVAFVLLEKLTSVENAADIRIKMGFK